MVFQPREQMLGIVNTGAPSAPEAPAMKTFLWFFNGVMHKVFHNSSEDSVTGEPRLGPVGVGRSAAHLNTARSANSSLSKCGMRC